MSSLSLSLWRSIYTRRSMFPSRFPCFFLSLREAQYIYIWICYMLLLSLHYREDLELPLPVFIGIFLPYIHLNLYLYILAKLVVSRYIEEVEVFSPPIFKCATAFEYAESSHTAFCRFINPQASRSLMSRDFIDEKVENPSHYISTCTRSNKQKVNKK